MIRLIAVAGLAEVLYLFLFAGVVPLTAYAAVPFKVLGSQFGSREAVVFVAGMAMLFYLYVKALRMTGSLVNERRALVVVLLFALLYGITLGAAYPVGSSDVFMYIFQGRELAHYQANPFAVAPIDFPDDPLVRYVDWPHESAAYGPLWIILSGVAALLYRQSLLLGLIAYKAIAVAFHLLTTVAVYWLLRKQQAPATPGTILFAWNPLVLFETAVNGHNDAAMACLAILAVVAFAAGRLRLSLPLLMASVLVKFITLILLPAFLLAWLRRPEPRLVRIRPAITGLAIAAMLAMAMYAPLWAGSQTLGPLKREGLFLSSLPALAYFWLRALGQTDARQIVTIAALLIFLLFALWRTLRVREGISQILAAGFDVLLAYLIVATFWFQPWYLLTLVPLAAALDNPWRRRLTVVFTASATLHYLFFYVWLAHPEIILQVQALTIVTLFVPPLLLIARRRGHVVRTAQ